MRISDWSSDVCSSDLRHIDRAESQFRRVLFRSAREDVLFVPFRRVRRDRVGGEAARHFLNGRLIVGQPELHDVSQDKAGVKPSPNPCPFSPIFAVYQIFCITEPKSSSSEGSSFGFANGLETQVSDRKSTRLTSS